MEQPRLWLVTGGREFADWEFLSEKLYSLCRTSLPHLIIHGGAAGADIMAERWATGQGIHTARVNALWAHYHKASGPIRNEIMMYLRPTLGIAFPGGTGTNNMCIHLLDAGVPLEDYRS